MNILRHPAITDGEEIINSHSRDGVGEKPALILCPLCHHPRCTCCNNKIADIQLISGCKEKKGDREKAENEGTKNNNYWSSF